MVGEASDGRQAVELVERLAPDGDPRYRHGAEGPDDMPAHVRSVLTQSDLNIPVRDGRCALGTWQGIFFCEYDGPRRRKVHVKVLSE